MTRQPAAANHASKDTFLLETRVVSLLAVPIMPPYYSVNSASLQKNNYTENMPPDLLSA